MSLQETIIGLHIDMHNEKLHFDSRYSSLKAHVLLTKEHRAKMIKDCDKLAWILKSKKRK